MAMRLILVKGCPLNGTSYASNFATLTQQLNFINSYPCKTYNVNTVRLGENIRLGDSISNLMGYNYGYIDYGDGFYYFIAVTSISMVTETQTEITYFVDAYETVCNQRNLTFMRSYITKYPEERGDVHLPASPYFWKRKNARSHKNCSFIALVNRQLNDTQRQVYTYIIPISSENDFRQILRGGWVDTLNTYYIATEYPILPSDIYIACVCPFPFEIFDNAIWTNVDTGNHSNYPIYTNPYYHSVDITLNLGFAGLTSTLYERDQIRDIRGNVIWECPVGHYYSLQNANLNASATACSVNIRLEEGNDIKVVSVPCEIVDIYDDSWKEYLGRQRESDKALRQLQYQQQAVEGLANIGSSAIGGSMAGSLASAGGGMGAVLGVASGIVSTLGTYATNQYFDPKIQEQYDRAQARAQDGLLLAGSTTEDMFNENFAGKVTVIPDDISRAQFEGETDTYGYSTSLYLESDPRVNDEGTRLTGPMRGSVDITADCPADWITQIASRFDMGIYFIRS